jgi:hypothetical protein
MSASVHDAVLGPISKAAASGSMSPTDRISLGFAEAMAGHVRTPRALPSGLREGAYGLSDGVTVYV